MRASDLVVQVVESRNSLHGKKDDLLAYLQITNRSEETLGDNWRLYFSLDVSPLGDNLPVAATLIEGRYGYLSPTEHYLPIAPGETLSIPIANWLFNGMPARARQGFHLTWVTGNGQSEPESVSTLPPDLQPLDRLENSWIRDMSPSCDCEPQTPRHLFEKYSQAGDIESADDELPTLIPAPRVFDLEDRVTWYGPPDSYPVNSLSDASLPSEGFVLTTSEGGATIESSSPAGDFYGRQALSQMMQREGNLTRLPQARITDSPDSAHRAVFIDISRHFQPLAELVRLVRAMGRYRLNRLQLGIANDEGWRLELPGIPELTDIGARRGFYADDADGTPRGLYPAWGDDQTETWQYLTTKDFLALLKEAAKHHVEVILEVNLPGHANALIRAMSASGRYQVTDPSDQSRHRSAQGYTRNVVNVALPDVYQLADDIFSSLKSLYQTAGVPFSRIHLGGDEVPDGAWLDSPACHGADFWDSHWNMEEEADRAAATAACYRYYAENILQTLRQVAPDISAGFWHEMSPYLPADEHIYVNAWLTEQTEPGVIDAILDRGQQLVISNASFLYLDMPHGLHAEETGLPWAAYIDTDTIYHFNPLENWGIAPGHPQVMGLQAQLWSETTTTPEAMHQHLFPRMLAVAERAWNNTPATEEWPAFAAALGERELPWLLEQGIHPRVPPPGVIVRDGHILANIQFPGLTLEYSTHGDIKGSESWLTYTGPFPVAELGDAPSVHVVARAGDHLSRIVTLSTGP